MKTFIVFNILFLFPFVAIPKTLKVNELTQNIRRKLSWLSLKDIGNNLVSNIVWFLLSVMATCLMIKAKNKEPPVNGRCHIECKECCDSQRKKNKKQNKKQEDAFYLSTLKINKTPSTTN